MPNLSKLPHGRAWNMAWPLMLSNLTTPLMGLADTAMLGHLSSPAYLAAAAIGANVLTFSLWVFGFLRMGTTSLTGQALGAREAQQVRLLLYRGLLLGAALGLALIVLQFWLLPQILEVMTPDQAVRELAFTYCLTRFVAAPAVLMTYAAIGWFIGLQRSRIPLMITLLINLVNLVLDWLLIIQLGWGSDGAALASACAEYVGLVLVIMLVVRELRRRQLPEARSRRWVASGWRPLIRINSDLFVRTACLLAVFSFFTAQGAHFGAEYVAANAILLQLVLLASHGLDGYAHAVESLVAEATGRRNLSEFARACLAAGTASVALAGLLSLVFLAVEPFLVQLVTDLPAIRHKLHEYWPWLVALPLASVWSYLFDGIFIGAGHTRALRNWMVVSVFLIFAPLWWLALPWLNHGLWLAFTLFNLGRGGTLAIAFAANWRGQRWCRAASR